MKDIVMAIPARFTNVEMDKNSAYSFQQINESVFLIEFFNQLAQLLSEDFEKYHFYIYANIDIHVLPDSLNIKSPRKKVLIFLSSQNHQVNPGLPGDFFAVFKCHLAVDVLRERIFHFPLGYVKETLHQPVKRMEERTVNVFYSGNLNKGRVPLYKLLAKSKVPDVFFDYLIKLAKRVPNLIKRDFSHAFPASYIQFTDGFKKGLSPQAYTQMLYNSRIVLCPKGFLMAETYRHFEAMRAGCVIISEKLPQTYLYKNSPIIQVASWKEGLAFAENLLKDSVLLQQYHQRTLYWWENVCNEASTARHVAEILISLGQLPVEK
jgi:hypothetical protein